MMKKAIDDASREKGIQWNKVTWYSWALAVVVFFGVIPAAAFYLGTEYGALRVEQGKSAELSVADALLPENTTTDVTSSAPTPSPVSTPKKTTPSPVSSSANSMTTSASGRPEVKGTVMVGPMCTKAENKGQQSCNDVPYQKSIEIWKSDDTFVKSIAVSIYGTFQTELTPGAYFLRLPKNSVIYPRLVKETPFTIVQGKITHLPTITLDTGIR